MVNLNNNSSEISYFKIGTFVLVGIGLIIFALLIFGSRKMLERICYIETYFEESVQGISKGTAVKYRGLQIGYVEDIAFSSEIYRKNVIHKPSEKMHTRSIYVKIAITSKLFTQLSDEELKEFLTREVNRGLRVRIVSQGLTGISYLEFDYVDPKNNPFPEIGWVAHNFYIPSVTSTLTKLSENASNIMNDLQAVNFKRLFSDIDILAISLHRLVNKTENLIDQTDYPIVRMVKELNIVTDNLREISRRISLKPSEIVFSSPPPPLEPNKL